MLFAKDRASGVASETAKERRKRMINNEDTIEIVDETVGVLSTSEIGLENINNGDDIQVTTTPRCSQMKSKTKKKKVEEESDFASKIQSYFEEIVDAMKECTKVSFVYIHIMY